MGAGGSTRRTTGWEDGGALRGRGTGVGVVASGSGTSQSVIYLALLSAITNAARSIHVTAPPPR